MCRPTGASHPRQFTLRTLFYVTAAVACVLGVARVLGMRNTMLGVFVPSYLFGPLMLFFGFMYFQSLAARVLLSIGVAAMVVVSSAYLGGDDGSMTEMLVSVLACWAPQACVILVIAAIRSIKP